MQLCVRDVFDARADFPAWLPRQRSQYEWVRDSLLADKPRATLKGLEETQGGLFIPCARRSLLGWPQGSRADHSGSQGHSNRSHVDW